MEDNNNLVIYRKILGSINFELVYKKYKDNYKMGSNELHKKIYNSDYKDYMIQEFGMKICRTKPKKGSGLWCKIDFCYFDNENNARRAAEWYNSLIVIEKLIGVCYK